MPRRQQVSTNFDELTRRLGQVVLLLLWWLPVLPGLERLVLPGHTTLFTEPALGVVDAGRTEILLLSLLALAASGWKPSLPPQSSRWSGFWIIAFLVWGFASSLLGPDKLSSLFFWQTWVAAACLLLAVPRLCPRKLALSQRVWLIHAPLVVLCVLSLTDPQTRVAGPFELPGVLSNWLLLIAPLAFHEFFFLTRWREALLALIPSCLAVVSTILTFSRAAWIVMLFQITALVLLETGKSWKQMAGWLGFWAGGVLVVMGGRGWLSGWGLLAVVGLVAVFPILYEALRGRCSKVLLCRVLLLAVASAALYSAVSVSRSLVSDAGYTQERWTSLAGKDNSAVSRLEFWRTAIVLAAKNPWFGVGPSLYGESYPQVQQYYYYYSDSVHSGLLELLAELGIVGAFLFCMALVFEVRRVKPQPAKLASQRGLLIGVGSALVYAQVELSYKFAFLWIIGAMVWARVERDNTRVETRSLWFSWSLVGVALLLLYPLHWQRSYAKSLLERDSSLAYRRALEVSNSLPAWSAPALTALGLGLANKAAVQELESLARRVLTWAPKTAASHQMAGDLALRMERLSEARAHYEAALALDRFNYPGIYQGLLQLAQQTDDEALLKTTRETVLARYDLSKWGRTHLGHRAQLLTQLEPLLSDIADGLSPFDNPSRTEPIYRFLAEERPSARAFYGLGVSLRSLGRVDEGGVYLRKAHALDPVFPLPVSR